MQFPGSSRDIFRITEQHVSLGYRYVAKKLGDEAVMQLFHAQAGMGYIDLSTPDESALTAAEEAHQAFSERSEQLFGQLGPYRLNQVGPTHLSLYHGDFDEPEGKTVLAADRTTDQGARIAKVIRKIDRSTFQKHKISLEVGDEEYGILGQAVVRLNEVNMLWAIELS